MRRLLAAVVVSVLGATPLLAQTSPDEQARRLLQDGRAYWKDGKFKQALDNFNTIVAGFPKTDSVDDALLEIGRYYAEVAGDDAKARQAFEQVTQRFPQSDGAPGAYFYLGWLILKRASTQAELDDALAQFTRVQRLYPRSEWVPRALHASGLAQLKAGKFSEATALERRVTLEYPVSDVAAAAQLQVGLATALEGRPRDAMEEFQRVRNGFPGTPEAKTALDRITALYRLYGADKPSFTPDPSFSLSAGDVLKDVRAILKIPNGMLWIASDKVNAAVPFDAQGKMGPSRRAEDLRTLSLAPDGELVIAAKTAVRIGPHDIKSFAVPDKPGEMRDLDKIGAAAKTAGGSLLVADEKSDRIYRYDREDKYLGPFPDTREREVLRIVIDPEGAIVILDGKSRTVEVFDEQGHPIRSVALRGNGYDLRKPRDVAVDPFRNIYLADEEAGVVVLSPEGRLLATVGQGELQKPRALTLDESGAIIVYDDKDRRLVRFR